MRKLMSAVIAGILLMPLQAHAQWIYQGEESAFGNDSMHVAATGVSEYGLGVRCKGSKTEMIYSTPDTSFDKDTYTLANALKPKLRVRIDDQEIIDLSSELQDSKGKALVIADLDLSLIYAMRDAKRRVAVVLKLMDENFHENSFNVRGSTAAIDKMLKGCNLSK